MTGALKMVPLRVQSVGDAYSGDASCFLHGYFTGHVGALRFQVESEDAARHKMTAGFEESGDVLPALNAVAMRLDSAARPFSTSSPEALAAWGRGDFEHAVAIDPDFGAAWLSWIDSLASRNAAEAAGVARRALQRSSLRSEVERVKIEVAAAALAGDSAAREQALTKLAGLAPNDAVILHALADAQQNARDFAAAAESFRKILQVDPRDAGAMNLLGYAEAQAGNLEAARKSLEEYQQQPGQKANALDSLGEAYFMNGRFAEAEKYFLQAQQTDPAFLSGDDLHKAAISRWLNGDLPGADTIMKRYLDSRRNDPIRDWRQAAWLYSTGRREQAIAALQSVQEKNLAARQMAVWNARVPEDPSPLKKKYEQTPPAADGQVRTFYAAALLASGDKDGARKLLALWPLPDERGDPLVESMVYPEFIELRKAVGLAR